MKKRLLYRLLGCIVGVGIFATCIFGIFFQYGGYIPTPFNDICKKRIIEDKIIQGDSMYPLLENGQTVQVMTNFQECGGLERGDIVIYNYGGNLRTGNPLIKRIVGVAGDSFLYSSGKILINGTIVTNSAGEEYIMSSKMLELYATDYPVIPPRTLLLLGDRVGGTTDSSVFGMVSEDDIIGKVVKY